MSFALAMLVALAIDAVIGWPDALFRRVGHPVTWIGRFISLADTHLNPVEHGLKTRAFGVFALVSLLFLVGTLTWIVQSMLPDTSLGTVTLGVLAWPLIATRSMADHVRAVAQPLSAGDIDASRRAVAMIVGRDPSHLDEAGIARAGLESLAENTSDGIIAPLFWGTLAGLPGIALYKAINTADSMIGHRTARYESFGWASARLDDLVNWIPARLTAGLFAIASLNPGQAIRVIETDARHHRSPNAGYPEAAMAAALNVRLSGPRSYGDGIRDEPWVNGTAPDPGPGSLDQGLGLFWRSIGLAALLLAIAGLL